MRLGWGLGLIILSVMLVAMGLGLCLWAIHHYLSAALDVGAASVATGLIALLTAGVLAWLAQRLSQ